MVPDEGVAHQLVGVRVHVTPLGAAHFHVEFGNLVHDVAGIIHRQPGVARVDFHVVLPGHPHHERAQRLGQHEHLVDLQLHVLLREQHLAALLGGLGVAQRGLAGIVADTERVGGKLEVAEQIAAGGVAAGAAGLAHRAAHVADHIGMRHPRVLEDHLAVLVEAPAALVEHLADAEAGRVAWHQEHGGALSGRHAGVGARVDEEQLADRRVGDERLLAVEDPFIALALGAQLQPGLGIVARHAVVGTGARLGDALAEHEGVVGDEGREEALLLLLGAGGGDQMAPFPVLAERLGNGAVGLGQLGHHQRLRHEIGALAAPFLRHRHGAEAELGALLDDVPVPGLARGGNGVARERERADLLVGEFARRHLPGALFVAQGEVHGSILT